MYSNTACFFVQELATHHPERNMELDACIGTELLSAIIWLYRLIGSADFTRSFQVESALQGYWKHLLLLTINIAPRWPILVNETIDYFLLPDRRSTGTPYLEIIANGVPGTSITLLEVYLIVSNWKKGNLENCMARIHRPRGFLLLMTGKFCS